MPSKHPVRRRLALPAAFSCLALALGSAHGQAAPDGATPLPETIVTAQRVAQPLSDVLADVTFIDREQVQRSGAVTVSDLLQRQAGLEVSRNGGPGTATSVFLRGADNRFTAVYIDGIRVDDQATGGAPWPAIALDQIDHIEILRGPAAAVYGSDAVAGVIQIFTRRGQGPFTPYVEAGVGSHHSGRLKAGFSGQTGPVDYSLGAERDTSRGFNSNSDLNPDRDGYRQSAANGRLGWQVAPGQRLELTGTYTKMDAQYDGFTPDLDDHGLNRLRTLGGAWKADWTRAYRTELSVSESDTRYETVPSPYVSKTRLRNYTFLNEWHQGPHRVTATLERREDHLVNDPIARGRHQNAVALGYGLSTGPHTLQLNVRYDRDSEFGGDTTGGVAYGYEFLPGWRVTAGASSAFRVPTLYQRFSMYGDASLRPEKARNVELGVRWADKGNALGATLYRNNIRNLVVFGAGGGCGQPFGCYGNAGRARLQGLTLDGNYHVAGFNLGGSFDWMDPTDRTSGKLLPRRARRMLKLNADTRVAGWTLGGEWNLFSGRFDDAANTVRLGGYGVLNLYAKTTVARDWDVLVRVDNLADKGYHLAQGYNTPGRVFFASLRWTPR